MFFLRKRGKKDNVQKNIKKTMKTSVYI